MRNLTAKPFYLRDDDIQWVNETLSSMTLEEKAGQVFCPMGFSADPGLLHHLIRDIGVGGMMYRPGSMAEIQNTHRTIQSMAKIPLLLAANTENGGNGLAFEGTSFGQPMAAAATGKPEISITNFTIPLPTCGPSVPTWIGSSPAAALICAGQRRTAWSYPSSTFPAME